MRQFSGVSRMCGMFHSIAWTHVVGEGKKHNVKTLVCFATFFLLLFPSCVTFFLSVFFLPMWFFTSYICFADEHNNNNNKQKGTKNVNYKSNPMFSWFYAFGDVSPKCENRKNERDLFHNYDFIFALS